MTRIWESALSMESFRISRKNVHEMGVSEVTAASQSGDYYNVVDYGWNGSFKSLYESVPWICFDFKEKSVHLTGYAMRSVRYVENFQWVIEGSNDSEDRPSRYSRYGRFINKSYRYLRLRHRRRPGRKAKHLCLSRVEFFGRLNRDPGSKRDVIDAEQKRSEVSFVLTKRRPGILVRSTASFRILPRRALWKSQHHPYGSNR